MGSERYGEWAFLAGSLLALVLGLLEGLGIIGGLGQIIPLMLVFFGLVVGLTTVTSKEIDSFLLATIALLAVSGIRIDRFLAGILANIFVYSLNNLTYFVAPAALVVALKSIYKIASSR
ncbi:MAG: hypothetical protein QXM68_00635 [Candidatus Aenigmatarchaeota archaeon]|nr:hypothetical protein [Candidatus Aenigmarchaeota archaeon]